MCDWLLSLSASMAPGRDASICNLVLDSSSGGCNERAIVTDNYLKCT